ncbi:thiolase C-terminal domain-containing protein [Sporosarcina sp. A2]|uniref:thiolase C-terminal domain-containing protein n=1 Tax=Sporosarcina sp. A2 TaxID=3393449 RepID=UPI003D7AE025
MATYSNQCAIVGVGENQRSRKSGTTPLHMALTAARNALSDAGLEAKDLDGIMNYSTGGDSCPSHELATYLGCHPKYVKDVSGGGSSTELLIADAVALIESGMLNTVLIYRSMNGSSGVQVGRGYDPNMLQEMLPGGSFIMPYGSASPSQWFGMFANRHMHETGITKEHLGHVCISFYEHAQRNPNAFLNGKPLDMETYLATPDISMPFNIHDCCVELDEANAIIVTSAANAKNCKSKPVFIAGMAPRTTHSHVHYWTQVDEVAADHAAADLYKSAGVKPEDIQVASLYDCFSWVVLRQLESYGFAKRGEVGDFVAAGNLKMGGSLPSNTAGGMLSEGYTHGMNNVLELVRQLRHDYKGTDRQVKDCELGIATGWAGPDIAGAMILRN